MNRDDVLRWESGFLTAQQEERRLIRKEGVNCEHSIRLALALIETARQMHKRGAPLNDSMWEHDVSLVRDRWCQLKKALTK